MLISMVPHRTHCFLPQTLHHHSLLQWHDIRGRKQYIEVNCPGFARTVPHLRLLSQWCCVLGCVLESWQHPYFGYWTCTVPKKKDINLGDHSCEWVVSTCLGTGPQLKVDIVWGWPWRKRTCQALAMGGGDSVLEPRTSMFVGMPAIDLLHIWDDLEHLLWASSSHPISLPNLTSVLLAAWAQIPIDTFQNFVQSLGLDTKRNTENCDYPLCVNWQPKEG